MMKLSEAMRLGAMATLQCFEGVHTGPVEAPISTCALGAAFFAVGDLQCKVDKPEWRWASDWNAECPLCNIKLSVGGIIVHLNDDHHWTRERIADWVATVEPELLAITQPEEERVGVCCTA